MEGHKDGHDRNTSLGEKIVKQGQLYLGSEPVSGYQSELCEWTRLSEQFPMREMLTLLTGIRDSHMALKAPTIYQVADKPLEKNNNGLSNAWRLRQKRVNGWGS